MHIAVYVGLLAFADLDTIMLLWPGNGIRILNIMSLSLGLGSAKLSIDNQNSTSFFYQNRHTLLSSLVDAADEIDRTVVFEDMDRLERADCLSLFTRLRELNQEVNLYIKKVSRFDLSMCFMINFFLRGIQTAVLHLFHRTLIFN